MLHEMMRLVGRVTIAHASFQFYRGPGDAGHVTRPVRPGSVVLECGRHGAGGESLRFHTTGMRPERWNN